MTNVAKSPMRPVLLCVDDDEQLLETIEYLLAKHFPAYDVVACPGGVDALEQLTELKGQSAQVQLVLSDQVMPEVTGIELLSRVPEHYPDAVRIILTGQAGLQSAIDAIKGGVDDYLEKPLSEIELVKTIRTHLNNYLLRQENRRLQAFLRQSRRRTSQITDLAFTTFNEHLTQLLSGGGKRDAVMAAVRRSRENISLLSFLYRIDQAIERGEAFTPIEVDTLITDILQGLAGDEAEPLWEERGLEIDLVNFEQGHALTSNRPALRIVLERLLDNACRHAPEGSPLTITIRGPLFNQRSRGAVTELPPAMADLLLRGFYVVSIRNESLPSVEDAAALANLQQGEGLSDGARGLRGLGLVIAQEYLLLLGGQMSFDAIAGRPGVEVHAAFPNRAGSPQTGDIA